jgi:hypothetical protein
MVQLAMQDSMMIYVVFEGGRAIGRVLAPTGDPVLGAGAGTVLLRRSMERPCHPASPARATAADSGSTSYLPVP